MLWSSPGPLIVSHINSLAPGRFEWNFRSVISVIDGWGIVCEIALRWMSLDLTDDNATLVQVMAWCRQATSHYLNQCWPRYLTPYGVTMPQWVNSLAPGRWGNDFRNVSFKLFSQFGVLCTSCEIGLWWVPQNPIDVKSTLVQAMAPSHYLGQYWPKSMSAYGITRQQWVNINL